MARGDRRCQIMHAAERLFTSRRFHEITLDDVARIARVGKGTIYRYFENKEDLFFQTVVSGFDELCDLVKHSAASDAPFREQLIDVCRQISSFYERRRELIRMMHSEEGSRFWREKNVHRRWEERRSGLVQALADIFAKGVAAGRIRGDVTPEALAAYLLGLLRARGRDLAEAPASMRRPEMVVDLFCNGAGNHAASSRWDEAHKARVDGER